MERHLWIWPYVLGRISSLTRFQNFWSLCQQTGVFELNIRFNFWLNDCLQSCSSHKSTVLLNVDLPFDGNPLWQECNVEPAWLLWVMSPLIKSFKALLYPSQIAKGGRISFHLHMDSRSIVTWVINFGHTISSVKQTKPL